MPRHNRLSYLVLALLIGPWTMLFAAQAENPAASTAADQLSVAVTVYNSNLALVRDVRRLRLPQGVVDLRFLDIAAKLDPASVHLASLTAAQDLAVLEQSYEYDPLSPARLLDKYVGKDVMLVRSRLENNSTREEVIRATLLANHEGNPVWKVGSEIVTGMHWDRLVFPTLPENLYSQPTLLWRLENRHAGEQTVEARYLTDDVSWNADYVLTVDPGEKTGELNGWATLANHSGTTFRNAQLQLVAGALHRVEKAVPLARMETMGAAPAGGAFAQEAISEYHLYSLSRPTTLADNETKQLSLLRAEGVHLEKHYEVDGQPAYYQNAPRPGVPIKDPVQVHLKFKNSPSNGLGQPLPGGTVRVYQTDSQGHLQFAGEDRIGHTPKDETVDLQTGSAFDVVEERRQTAYEKIDGRTSEMAYEIAARNHQPEAIALEVNEPFPGDWTILESNFPYEKTSSSSARFTLPVPANGAAALKYRVRVKW
jgi:hypothetical protein